MLDHAQADARGVIGACDRNASIHTATGSGTYSSPFEVLRHDISWNFLGLGRQSLDPGIVPNTDAVPILSRALRMAAMAAAPCAGCSGARRIRLGPGASTSFGWRCTEFPVPPANTRGIRGSGSHRLLTSGEGRVRLRPKSRFPLKIVVLAAIPRPRVERVDDSV
jgi:hypothetical protein